MYRNVLRQAQEAIAREHIVPMRIYYLNKTESFDPMVDFNKVASDFAEQLNKSIRDPNHKVVSPVPVNMLNIGGEGRALLLTPEIEQVQAEILAGMNMPREFIFGGVSYSGSSISLKILENQFITYRLLLNDFIQNFIIKNMAKARKEWVSEKDDDSLIRSKFQDLKMQDDVQQKQVIIQLNGAGKCSNDYMWKVMGFDADNMREAIEKEAVMAVESESKVQMAKVKAELQIQKMQMQAQMELQLFQTQLQKSYTEQYPGVFPQTPTPAEQQQMQAQQEQAQAEAMAQQQGQAQQGQQPQAQPAQQTEPAQQEQQTEAQVPGGGPSDQEIQSVALKLVKLPEESRQRFLGTLPQDVAKKVVEVVSQLDHNKKLEEKAQPDMRPLPEQKPPRRDSLK
jgi:hypothetical protein